MGVRLVEGRSTGPQCQLTVPQNPLSQADETLQGFARLAVGVYFATTYSRVAFRG